MIWQSVWAVVAGVLFIIVVGTIVNVVMHSAGFYPPRTDKLALLATAYRIVISVGGAWLTAKLAPSKPMKHALILGLVGVVLGSIGLAVTWKLGLGPHWYPIALVVLAIPQCWLGGKLYERVAAGRAAAAA